jgi:hypothetical protein
VINNQCYAVGSFTNLRLSSATLPSPGLAFFNGSDWVKVDLETTMTALRAVWWDGERVIVAGDYAAGNGATTYSSTVTNNGTRSTYPVLVIQQTGATAATLHMIKNFTTGTEVITEHTLLQNETLTIDFRPGSRSVVSSRVGSVWAAVRPDSGFADFRLLPGTNTVGVFLQNGDATIYMTWTEYDWSIDGVVS